MRRRCRCGLRSREWGKYVSRVWHNGGEVRRVPSDVFMRRRVLLLRGLAGCVGHEEQYFRRILKAVVSARLDVQPPQSRT